ncbi:immunity 22 family protein [Pedobacter psychrodurus]|uniref:immunity 22 family protein n=1 Tax=Pedobacter psychrodurus TaxID=2530456 RepID=UPI00292F00A5|nr:immunity 22 family protein [Pedobacter psychrodurus]
MHITHLWAGKIESERLLETYLDQNIYLKAWAAYDHGPSIGGHDEDSEPSPTLRCQFCKETGLDTYDEDLMIFKYYDDLVDINTIARDSQVDTEQLRKLFKKNKMETCNAIIAYQDKSLNPKQFSYQGLLRYLGQLDHPESNSKTNLKHYLWTGEVKVSPAQIIKSTGLQNSEIKNINFYYNKAKKRLDEIIIMEVQDLDLAERMILEVDDMYISPTSNAILVLTLNKDIGINAQQIGQALGLDFISEFDSE